MKANLFLSKEEGDTLYKKFKESDESSFIRFLYQLINITSVECINVFIDQIEEVFQSYSDISLEQIHNILNKIRKELLETQYDDFFEEWNMAVKNGEYLIIHNDYKS